MMLEQIKEASNILQVKVKEPLVGIVLGTGLGNLASK